MKLDRNLNPDGRGKYALVKMRTLTAIEEAGNKPAPNETAEYQRKQAVVSAFNTLVREGVITLGNETPGDQFFVMKYKDKFTAPALQAYADAVYDEAMEQDRIQAHGPKSRELLEYHAEMESEAVRAEVVGKRIPD